MSAAEVRVLGPVEVVGDAGDVVSLAAKQTRLLAALVVADGRACGVDQLVEAVWDGSAPRSARNLVQVYVSQLRKSLPSGIEVVTRAEAYAVEVAAERLDAPRFERLLGECEKARRDGNAALAVSLADRALSLWRGRAYGELAYEDFARAESDRLEELRLVALEERLDAQLALGRHAEALGEALALAEENPFRERSHELAMLALYRCGQQTRALEHYAAVRSRLHEEFGLEPGPALRELQRRILRQDPDLVPFADVAQTAVALPVPASPLVGRERELDELGALLARRHDRLIVLSGAGGSGKTRLALEAARRAAGSFANGSRLVELAPLRDPALVVPTIAHALDVPDDPQLEPLEALAASLASQELLLLVDNAEHVREAAPSFAQLVARAPRLTLLVTSRAVLHVSGERVFPVSPLAEEDAVELFVQRTRLLEPSFAFTSEHEADVREICRRVDCLPLAIELAAARIRALTPRALRERLDSRLAVLTGGPRDLPARLRTLRETIAWSVDLLGERERAVFKRLAVFPGGAALESAEAVCGADLDTLATLIDDHLIHRRDADGEPRLGQLETVREYALELLGDELGAYERAFAEHFAALVERADLKGAAQLQWLARLDAELDNLRAALDVAADADSDLELRLAGRLWRYWWIRGFLGEGMSRIEAALTRDTGPPSSARAHALQAAAGLAWSCGDHVRAKEFAREAITVASAVGATWEEMAAHTVLGSVANTADTDYPTARDHFRRSIELAEALGQPEEVITGKLNLGDVALNSGDAAAAARLFAEGLEHRRRSGSVERIAFALLNLGQAQLRLGESEAARASFVEAYDAFSRVGFRARMAHALQALAAVDATEGNPEDAARNLGRARAELDDLGWSDDDSTLPLEVEAQLRRTLGDDAFDAAYEQGSAEPAGT